MTRPLWCCECQRDVKPRLTDGGEIYPWRPDLESKSFWICEACGNYVGCGRDKTPLGVIPTPELRRARSRVHAALDPIWKSGRMSRTSLYKVVAKRLGIPAFHTAEIRTLEEAEKALEVINVFNGGLSLRG